MKTGLPLFAALLLLCAASMSGQTVNGRLITSLYTWERHDTVGVSAKYMRAYQIVQLDVSKANVVLHTYLQGTTDFSNPLGNDPRIRVYNLFVDVKDIGSMADVKLGRQPVFARAGVSAIDGLCLKARPFGSDYSFTLYGGGLVPPDESGKFISNLKDNYLLGAQFVMSAIPNTRVGLQYLNRHIKPEAFTVIRRDTLAPPNDIKTISIDNASPANQYASVDVSYDSRSLFTMYGRLDFDISAAVVSRGEISCRYNVTGELGVTAEYVHREPRVPYNSIFSVFEHSGTNEFGVGADYFFSKLLSVYARYSYLSLEDTGSQQITVGLNAGYGSLVYAHNFGYSGDLDGIYAQIMYPFMNRKLMVSGGISYSSYRLSGYTLPGSQSDRESALTGLIGVTVRPVNVISFDVQGQLVTNRIYKMDYRLFVKVNYWFFQNLGWL